MYEYKPSDAAASKLVPAKLTCGGGKKGSPELRGLRPDGTRPSDVTWLNFHGLGKHLLIDATVASIYVASMLKHQRFNQPGYAVGAGRGPQVLQRRHLQGIRCWDSPPGPVRG